MARMVDGDKIIEALSLIAKCWSVSPFVSKEEHYGAVSMLREVEREVKKASTLTPQNEPRAGLYGKYTVYKNKDGSLVTDRFILRPAKDPAAIAALRAYATATDNAELAADIINWVGAEPNEPLSCAGCVYENNEHEECNYCRRAACLSDCYYRPPEGEEDT